jgi:hypothetical protein
LSSVRCKSSSRINVVLPNFLRAAARSAFDILFRREVQVELEFLLLFGIGKIAPKEAFPVHLPFSGRGFMMRPMARTSWSQREDCLASCFLPSGVRR